MIKTCLKKKSVYESLREEIICISEDIFSLGIIKENSNQIKEI